jgi:HSP20 family protein
MNQLTKTFIPTFPETILDVFFRDMLDNSIAFSPIREAKFHYPVDIKETQTGIEFDFAIVGVEKRNVSIEVDNDVLKISYENKNDQKDEGNYIHRGITRKSFNFAWKLGGKYDTSQVEAAMDKGILNIKIPYTKNAVKKLIEIK